VSKNGPIAELEASAAELLSFRPASERLAELPAASRAAVDQEIALFAHEARRVLGFDRLPEPVRDWATLGPDLDPGLRRLLPEGRLELRRWEGTFTLLRRPATSGLEAVRSTVGRLLGQPPAGAPVRAESAGEQELAEWQGSFQGGRFSGVLAVLAGKTLLFRLTPPLSPVWPERAHEHADALLRERVAARRRPPGVTAIPAPVPLPRGGRFGGKPRPAKKRGRP
jgi:hypothetical protein